MRGAEMERRMKPQQDQQTQPNLPSKGFVALLYIPLMGPALLPIYLSRDQEDPTLVAIMVLTSVAILLGNALMLVLVYRWFASAAKDD
jgi:hypothetical protein